MIWLARNPNLFAGPHEQNHALDIGVFQKKKQKKKVIRLSFKKEILLLSK